jgi:proteic killer suppression protein
VIKSFKSKETEKLFQGWFSSKLPQTIQRVAAIKLELIHAATVIETLRVPPSNHLEELKGKRKGQHSIRINKQWRICFTWKGSDAYDVEIADYH